MEVKINLSEDDIEYMRLKFDIKTEEDAIDAILECVSTYMEM